MLIKKPSDIPSSEITPRETYLNRRKFITGVALAGGAVLLGKYLDSHGTAPETVQAASNLNISGKSPFSTSEKQTPLKDITSYNNFYEFSSDKYEPARLAQSLQTRPWTVEISGLVKKPQKLDIDYFLTKFPQEERIFRLRCVEGWSMIIPWVGFSLGDLLKQVEPLSKAKYVKFTTKYDPKQMPGQRYGVLDWPYIEGLRLDEAMHPLATLATGMYGNELPKQDGAPIRLVVPWKYGFKSIKSIVKIELVDNQPTTTWQAAAPNEYGFYSNVNPEVDHPRWSQKKERRIGEFLKRDTLKFNGYGDQVAQLYAGMDLRKNF
ncbi:MAG TPA: protein-methionine-sulfoxide reductase catalytic subunit MsrP [Terriglobales bacterium]|nr:protein-methionine-sulfoxide reductase catalytic subunit MsrP [Terriglobales bacterium]